MRHKWRLTIKFTAAGEAHSREFYLNSLSEITHKVDFIQLSYRATVYAINVSLFNTTKD